MLVENTPIKVLLVALAVCTLAHAAQALINSPPPSLGSGKTIVLYTTAGVVNDGLGTVFICTNKSTATVQLGVQVFDNTGAQSGITASVSAAPGQTVSIATQGVMTAFVLDANTGSGGVRQGAARILTNGKATSFICSAYVADTRNDPPTSIASVPLFQAGKQKGE